MKKLFDLLFIFTLALVFTSCAQLGNHLIPVEDMLVEEPPLENPETTEEDQENVPPEVFSIFDVSFTMMNIPVPSKGITFPMGFEDNEEGSLEKSFKLAETQVTYELYRAVLDNLPSGYEISCAGKKGVRYSLAWKLLAYPTEAEHPATVVSFDCAVVFANALSELLDKELVYYCGEEPIKTSAAAATCGSNIITSSSNGFRLPENNEWEYAARYIGRELPLNSLGTPLETAAIFMGGIYFTPGNYASGATDYAIDYDLNVNPDESATRAVAVYVDAADSRGHHGTNPVKSKLPNTLGLYDMSGNVYEWTSNFHLTLTSERILRGYSWSNGANRMQVGRLDCALPSKSYNYVGFRLARNDL